MIIVGIDESAEAMAAAHWAVREADLRNDDVLMVRLRSFRSSTLGRRWPTRHEPGGGSWRPAASMRILDYGLGRCQSRISGRSSKCSTM